MHGYVTAVNNQASCNESSWALCRAYGGTNKWHKASCSTALSVLSITNHDIEETALANDV
jgi:hypothetical protein